MELDVLRQRWWWDYKAGEKEGRRRNGRETDEWIRRERGAGRERGALFRAGRRFYGGGRGGGGVIAGGGVDAAVAASGVEAVACESGP